jgi:hypothetical protein
MQSVSLFSAGIQGTVVASTDVLEIKAIAEYERDRKRAHKGHDAHIKRKGLFVVDSNVVSTNTKHTSSKSPAWRRAGNEEKERRVLNGSKFGKGFRDVDVEAEEYEQWVEDREEEDERLDKENRRSPSQSASVRLEELVVRSAAKGSKKVSRPLTSRPSTPRQISPNAQNTSFPTDLLAPLMDTLTIDTAPHGTTTTNDYDDGFFFEFSSPGADEWTVAATEDGGFTYATSTVASASSATTVVIMPCVW